MDCTDTFCSVDTLRHCNKFVHCVHFVTAKNSCCIYMRDMVYIVQCIHRVP